MKPYFTAILIVIADRISKWIVVHNMQPGESIHLIGDNLLRFTYVQNPGIAFGIRIIPGTFLAVFSIVTSLILIVILYQQRNQFSLMTLSLGLILGGAIGNVIDRLIYGKVVDFIDVDFPNFIMSRWPVFNIADSAVTIGMCLLAIYLIRQPSPQTASSTLSTSPSESQ
jgi:signal peptidase II